MGRETMSSKLYVRLGQAMAALMMTLGAGQVALAHLAAAEVGGLAGLFPPDLVLERLVFNGFVAMGLGAGFGLLTEVSRVIGHMRSGGV